MLGERFALIVVKCQFAGETVLLCKPLKDY